MQLAMLVATSEALRATRSRNAKRDALAEMLRGISPDEVAVAVSYLSGELPQGRIGLGYAAVYGAEATPAAEPSLSINDVDEVLASIAATAGPGSVSRRRADLEALMACATDGEQRFLRAVIMGELRQGALESSMMDAIAAVIDTDPERVRRAVMLSGDLTEVAVAALSKGTEGLSRFTLTVLRPVRPMLARTAEDVGAALERHSPASIEVKLDGARIQAHKQGEGVAVYTRNLRDITEGLPEVVHAVSAFDAEEAIVDGEVIALGAGGRPEPFQVTMSRFGSDPDPGAPAKTPLTPFFFDCLLVNGNDLLDEPLADRWEALAALAAEANLPRRLVTGSLDEALVFYEEVLAGGHEGVMVKDLGATYRAGRRGAGWLKVKPAHTLDLVVLAVEWGSGRREGLLSNLHLGARDPGSGEFVMLGKTFKGLTDEMLAWQTKRFLNLETHRSSHVVHVRPEQVVEIAFDGIQASQRYPGGMALRFARVKGYRSDKSAEESDSFETVREIFEKGHAARADSG